MFRVRTALLAASAALAANAAWAGETGWDSPDGALALRGGYVHLGLAYTKQADEGTLQMGGVPVPGADFTTDGAITASLEIGAMLRGGFGASISGIYPMTTQNIAAGTLTGMGNLGTETVGFYSATMHYHPFSDSFISPYVGGGIGYMHVFGTTDGVITNRPGALFHAQNAAVISWSTGSPLFDNAGTFRKSVSPGTLTLDRVRLNNYGTADIQSGTLLCTESVVNSGAVNLSAGTTNRLARVRTE